MRVQAHLRGAGVDRVTRGQGKGCGTQVDRVNAEHNVVHDRVRHQSDLKNIFDLIRCLASELYEEPIDRLANRAGQQFGTFGVHHHVGDPAHQVFAIADLGVHHARRGQYLARVQITEVRRDGGGADIDGNAARLVKQSRPDAGNKLLLIHRYRDTAVFTRQCGLQGM